MSEKVTEEKTVELSPIVEVKKDEILPIPPEEVKEALNSISSIATKITEYRKRPLLLMYYSDKCGSINNPDLDYLEDAISSLPVNSELDLILHTTGGDVSSSYFLARLIRSKCEKLYFIIPTHAYSGGTAIALASDQIEMGITSRISPIDIQLGNAKGTVSLLNLDKYIEFVNYTVDKFGLKDETDKAEIIGKMMLKLYENYKALDLGELFRLRSLHEIYANQLLVSYMFRYNSDKSIRAKMVVDSLTTGSPSHDFDIDINVAKDFGLNVVEMEDKLFKDSRTLIKLCSEEEQNGKICSFLNKEIRMPFFKLFAYNQTSKKP